MNKFIPVNEPLLNGNEKKYLDECIDTGWISFEGPFVKKFEKEFSRRVNRNFGISVSNGTAALEVAVAALNLNLGDEVILPTFTIISCAQAVTKAGLIPVLVDSDPYTYNMNISQIEKKITRKTKVIMVVHIYGLPVDMDPILEIAEKYNLFIIEDAAEMIGQTYKRRPCGSFGDISIFSFYPNKHITTGEGGMIVTDNENLAERCKSLRNLCFISEKRYYHEEFGWNYRLTNVQAAIGLAQMERLDEFVIRKREMGRLYTSLLKDVEEIQLPIEKMNYAENIYWVYGILINDSVKLKNVDIMKKLAEKKVGTRAFFYPMHMQPAFNKIGLFNNESYPISEKLAEKGFYIPSGLALTYDDIHEVSQRIKEVFNESL